MSILVWYFVLFAPQLIIGAGIGWWLGQRGEGKLPVPADDASEQRELELRNALSQLKLLTNSVQEDVREHAEKVDSSSRELAGIDPGDPQSAMNAIAPIVKANEELQRRLHETERKLAEQAEQLDKQTAEARTDPLTGLLNRRGLENELPELFEEYAKAQAPFCYTILDIDHFKSFNDDYGHDVGDVVLCEVARVVSGAVRRKDIVARFGGEEFVILSPDTDLHEAGKLLERVRKSVAENIVSERDNDLQVTVSLGVAQVMAEDAAALMKRADNALYDAKEAGRNRGYFHDGQQTHPITLREEYVEKDVRSDQLTSLPSRAAFTEELGRRIAESTRSKGDISLIVLEVDRLEQIQAEHDEATANLVRRGVAEFLTNIMREMDLVARNDDDSFCMMLPSCSLDDAARVAERVRSTAGQTPMRTDDVELSITLSAGVTMALEGESADQLLVRGQQALEESLRSGGNRTTIDGETTETSLDETSELPEVAVATV